MKTGTVLYPVGFAIIVVGIALSAAATAAIRNVPVCQDYCPGENLASIAEMIAYYQNWGFAGVLLAFLGPAVVIAKSFASTGLRTNSHRFMFQAKASQIKTPL